MSATKIEWCTHVWNPTRGCSRVSEGCKHCYAERQAIRQAGPGGKYYGLVRSTPGGPRWTGKVALDERTLLAPLHWRKPRAIFVNSMSDLFHKSLTVEQIDRVLAVMALCPQHTFLVLTKRPERLRAYMTARTSPAAPGHSGNAAACMWVARLVGRSDPAREYRLIYGRDDYPFPPWPLPNLALGVSVEDQATADARVLALLGTPAALRWVSYEPALGPVNWAPMFAVSEPRWEVIGTDAAGSHGRPALHGIVMGGESGPGARPMHPDWARQTRDQCAAAGVPFFFKQWGAHGWSKASSGAPGGGMVDVGPHRVGKKRAGRLLDGRTHDELAWDAP